MLKRYFIKLDHQHGAQRDIENQTIDFNSFLMKILTSCKLLTAIWNLR